MRCSLFGKLPAKRDFIALFSPRAFLDVWEPWIQGSISASRQELGEDWQNAFLTAPIWRFVAPSAILARGRPPGARTRISAWAAYFRDILPCKKYCIPQRPLAEVELDLEKQPFQSLF